jgi:hypothetical protein
VPIRAGQKQKSEKGQEDQIFSVLGVQTIGTENGFSRAAHGLGIVHTLALRSTQL